MTDQHESGLHVLGLLLLVLVSGAVGATVCASKKEANPEVGDVIQEQVKD